MSRILPLRSINTSSEKSGIFQTFVLPKVVLELDVFEIPKYCFIESIRIVETFLEITQEFGLATERANFSLF